MGIGCCESCGAYPERRNLECLECLHDELDEKDQEIKELCLEKDLFERHCKLFDKASAEADELLMKGMIAWARLVLREARSNWVRRNSQWGGE